YVYLFLLGIGFWVPDPVRPIRPNRPSEAQHASEGCGLRSSELHKPSGDRPRGKFHEEDPEIKKPYYSRDRSKKVIFNSNFNLYKEAAASWRDTLTISLRGPTREHTTVEYIKHIRHLGDLLFELLSEGLGLRSQHVREEMECAQGCTFVCHYYPPCPEPELTLGAWSHSDPWFLTLLHQDQGGGLQVLHNRQWVPVRPIPGSLIVNVGDFLQV
ncbi:hypothetical protein CRG98_014413, partial [Punica granatum]